MKRLFRLRKSRAILLRPVPLQALRRRLTAVVLHFIAQQHVDRRVEQVGQLDDDRQLRLGKPRLPLIDRAGRHAQAFGQLLLRESVLPAQRADIFRKSDLHIHPSRCLYRIRYRAGMKHTIHMIRTESIHTNSMDFWRHCRKTSCGAEVPVVFLPGIWYDE